jgi:N-acetylglucosaminyl-diphospho-decaprenol L-rhamnosyltransferase
MMAADVSVIIVNWHSQAFLEKCLESIYHRKVRNMRMETIVIDNASYDGSAEMVRERFPAVKFVQSERNIGFAGANNLGYRHSEGAALLFLNPDTEIAGYAIDRMRAVLESNPLAGAVNCRILNSDFSIQTSCIQPLPTILNQILDFEYVKMKTPGLKFWGVKPLFEDADTPAEVEAISGACFMVKRDVFEEVGAFSADYFMYTEDLDLCYKIRKAGYKIYHVREASMVHHGSASSNKAGKGSFSDVMVRESLFRFFVKTRGRAIAYVYRFSMIVCAAPRLMAVFALMPVMSLAHRKDRLLPVLAKWKGILRWALGMEKWAKELNHNREGV